MVFDSDEPSTTFHSIDVGVDYDKALSLTRTTQFMFGVSTTIAGRRSPGSDQPPFGDQRLYLLGMPNCGRSWEGAGANGPTTAVKSITRWASVNRFCPTSLAPMSGGCSVRGSTCWAA